MNEVRHNAMEAALRAGQRDEAHPDADVLTAFAEGALLERERAAVEEHLAVCAACRAVLTLAGAAAEETDAGARERAARAQVRVLRAGWAAAAAGVLLAAGTAAWQHWGAGESRTLTARTDAGAAPARPAATTPTAATQAETAQSGTERRREARAKTATQEAKAVAEPATASASAPAGAAKVESAAAMGAFDRLQQERAVTSQPRAAGPAYDQGQRLATAFAGQVQNADASPVHAHWRINGAGQVERALGGEAWQTVTALNDAEIHAISVVGGEVWAGGAGMGLYRSRDNGATWARVTLPAKNGATHTIVHVRFQSAADGTAEAEDGTAWTTTDGGASWK